MMTGVVVVAGVLVLIGLAAEQARQQAARRERVPALIPVESDEGQQRRRR